MLVEGQNIMYIKSVPIESQGLEPLSLSLSFSLSFLSYALFCNKLNSFFGTEMFKRGPQFHRHPETSRTSMQHGTEVFKRGPPVRSHYPDVFAVLANNLKSLNDMHVSVSLFHVLHAYAAICITLSISLSYFSPECLPEK